MDIKTVMLNELRSQIGYVGQEPILFNQTIRENILMGLPDELQKSENNLQYICSDENIVQCLKLANAEFVLSL